jgi:hypothetical protein
VINFHLSFDKVPGIPAGVEIRSMLTKNQQRYKEAQLSTKRLPSPKAMISGESIEGEFDRSWI